MTELICIVCPKGCHIKVDESNDFSVTGHGCKRGVDYGRSEIQNPTRVITSTVIIDGAIHRRCPVKTDKAIPKAQILNAIKLLESIRLISPVKSGDIVYENILQTGANFIITRDMQ